MDDYEKYIGGLRARAEADRKARLENRARPEAGKGPPDYYQRTREREGNSPFSGGWAGGGPWAGRPR
ncbi:MAG: hypothetical protein ABSH52_30675 [Terriglobia bacterium]|jgi:hypothetical protein